jgi:hypothetical protein
MDKDVRDALELITNVLDLLNSNLEEIDKRVTMLEVTKNSEDIDNDFITIKIPKNASNLDVIRILFNCKIVSQNLLYTHIDIDDDTVFRNSWLKTKYKRG